MPRTPVLPVELRDRILAPAALCTPRYYRRLILIEGRLEKGDIVLDLFAPGTFLPGLQGVLLTRLQQALMYTGFMSEVKTRDQGLLVKTSTRRLVTWSSLEMTLQLARLQLPLCLPYQEHRVFAIPQGTQLALAHWSHQKSGAGLSFVFPAPFMRDRSVPTAEMLAHIVSDDLMHFKPEITVTAAGGGHAQDPLRLDAGFNLKDPGSTERTCQQIIDVTVQVAGYRLFLPSIRAEIIFAPDRPFRPA